MQLRLAAPLFAAALCATSLLAQTATPTPATAMTQRQKEQAVAGAQAKVQATKQSTVARLAVSANCPVGLRAERKATGRVYPAVATVGNSDFAPPELHLTFAQQHTTGIAALTLLVHGFPRNMTHAVPAMDLDTATASQAFRLKADTGLLDHADLKLTQLSGAQSVELTHLEFTDGTTWTKSTESKCVAMLNGLLLIQ